MYLEINFEQEELRSAFSKSDTIKPQVRVGQATSSLSSCRVISSDGQTCYEVEFIRSLSKKPFGSYSRVDTQQIF